MIYRCDLVPQYKAYKKQINNAIQRVLNSGRYTLGQEVKRFEDEFARYIGQKYAVSVANGTDAIILSLRALRVGPGDEVITTPFTAIPTCSAIIATGAKPVFVDIDPSTFLIDINKIALAITKKTKAIIPVHIFGNVVDIKKIRMVIGTKLPIIEDACQSHGSKIDGYQTGSLGTLAAFSFYPTKNLGGYGDGGMITTKSKQLADRIKLLRMYGMIDKDHITTHGINSRLDELQAAILRGKLKHLDEMNKKRQILAKNYKSQLKQDLFEYQLISRNVYCNYHVFVSRFKADKTRFIKYMDDKGIQTNIYYLMPLQLQKANKYLGYKRGDLPNSELVCEQVLALPLYPELPIKTQSWIIKIVNDYK